MIIYTIILFVVLTPSILVRLPKKGNKYTVAFVHGTIFAIIFHFTHKFVNNMNHKENFRIYDGSGCKIENTKWGPKRNIIPDNDSGSVSYRMGKGPKQGDCVYTNIAK